MEETITVIVGKYKKPMTLIHKGNRMFVKFGYNKKLIEEVKSMEGAKWHGFEDPPKKMWSIAKSPRNQFQLDFLQGKNPYERYDKELISFTPRRECMMDHQITMTRHAITRNHCIFACEMGTGKSLSAIELMEWVKENHGLEDCQAWYVGPKAGVFAVGRELEKWESLVKPDMYTYEALTRIMKTWKDGDPAPKVIIFDESSKIKTPTSQRSQAALHISNAIREEWGDEGFIIEMSGTPAPKTPVDWWHQCCAYDTIIQTDHGLQQMSEICSKETIVVVRGKKIKTAGSYKSGTKLLYSLKTSEGYSIRATEGHRFLVDYDGIELWRRLDQLEEGDNLIIDCGISDWMGHGSEDDGYILGILFGDGNVYKNKYGRLKFFECDYSVIPRVCSILGTTNVKTNYDSSGNEYKDIHGGKLNDLVREYGINNTKVIDSLILGASSNFIRGFIQGMFDSDGHAERSRLRISLTQTNKENMAAIQLMLQSLGIYSKVSSKPVRSGCIDGRNINSSDTNTLIITNQYARLFSETIGFHNQYKQQILDDRINNSHNWETKPLACISDIRENYIEDVYDIEVPTEHAFSANGIIVHNCEVACPGFLKEGNVNKFKKRMCIIEERESITGGVYPHIVSWLDDSSKCAVCGELKDHTEHKPEGSHGFVESVNEVQNLYKRMTGLVLVQFKKDCLDLPDKQYKIIRVQPTIEMLRAAKIIKTKAKRAIEALNLCRELSDGFQYTDKKVGDDTCPNCGGIGKSVEPVAKKEIDVHAPNTDTERSDFETEEIRCPLCLGSGKVPKYERATDTVASPKDEVFINMLDEHDDVGRFIVWGGFHATIDRLVAIAHQQGWATLKVDGRGYIATDVLGQPCNKDDFLDAMDLSHPRHKELLETYPKICFIGHPQAGGMALTLTASPTELFFSNAFNGEARMQAEDRFHRTGMDMNRGATVIDIFCLPTDKLVLDNLKKKKKLQDISMGELQDAFENTEEVVRR